MRPVSEFFAEIDSVLPHTSPLLKTGERAWLSISNWLLPFITSFSSFSLLLPSSQAASFPHPRLHPFYNVLLSRAIGKCGGRSCRYWCQFLSDLTFTRINFDNVVSGALRYAKYVKKPPLTPP
jgi:hypothetical protein